MKKKSEEFGRIINAQLVEDPSFYEIDPATGISLAVAKRDYGPAMAIRNGNRAVEVVERKIDGKVCRLSIVVTTLRTMYRKGSITEEMYNAGIDFKINYDFSGLEPLRAQDISRIPGGGYNDGEISAVTDAKNFVFQCWRILGNKNTIMSRAVTLVIGREVSLRDMAVETGHNAHFWSGAVMSALELLVEKKDSSKKRC